MSAPSNGQPDCLEQIPYSMFCVMITQAMTTNYKQAIQKEPFENLLK